MQKQEINLNEGVKAQQEGLQEESKDQNFSLNSDTIDENTLSKNSYSLILGGSIRKHGISPKNINLNEFRVLLQNFKALFKLVEGQKTPQSAKEVTHTFLQDIIDLVKVSAPLKKEFDKDAVKFQGNIQKLVLAQHLGMVSNIKGLIYLQDNQIVKSIQNVAKGMEEESKQGHPSCYHEKVNDENAKNDAIYKNCNHQHPQYYFNNLGVMHIKLQKYNMAMLYLSKALKFLDKSQNGQANPTYQPNQNPNHHISHLSSQKHAEVLLNYGIALYKSKRYEEAFRCFEKVSLFQRGIPIMWYYMGLCCLYFNQEKVEESVASS
mmetsp:Transcript_7389/g.6641  ORF Transcript_7389/g.6641 Transcript_7389/m.6641 type:complete len:321 (-) Transcript_7389:1197-2159(-)